MGVPLPKISGIETYYFSKEQRWMAYWFPYHWGWRGWGNSEAEAINDLKKRDPYKAAELAKHDDPFKKMMGSRWKP